MYGGSRIPGTGLLYKVEATRVPLVKRSGPYEIQREDQPQQNYLVFQSPRPLELLGMRDEDAKVCTFSLCSSPVGSKKPKKTALLSSDLAYG